MIHESGPKENNGEVLGVQTKVKRHLSARTGQKSVPGIYGMGTSMVGPLNWLVLVKQMCKIAPRSTKLTLPRVRWAPGFQDPLSFGTKFPDQRKEKKPMHRAAQRASCLQLWRLTKTLKDSRSLMVR